MIPYCPVGGGSKRPPSSLVVHDITTRGVPPYQRAFIEFTSTHTFKRHEKRDVRGVLLGDSRTGLRRKDGDAEQLHNYDDMTTIWIMAVGFWG